MRHIPSSKSTIIYRLSALDVAAAAAAPILALWLRTPAALVTDAPAAIATYVTISLCVTIGFFTVFRIARSLPEYFSIYDVGEIAKASLCSVTTAAAIAFTITRLDQIPRSVPAIHFLTLLALLLVIRFLHGKMARRRQARVARAVAHDDERNVIVVGAGSLASLYVGFLDAVPRGGWRIAAILDDSRRLHGRSILGHTIVAGTEDAEALLEDFDQHGLKISAVVVCAQDRAQAMEYRNRLEPLCRSRGLQIETLLDRLDIFEDPQAAHAIRSRPANLPNASYFRAKRAFERAIAAVGLVVFLPVLALTGLAVLASAGSPAIFWQRRVGLHGRTVFVYKFKTMRNAVDGGGRLLSAPERSTRVGQILRATRLDELPQLFNVIKGDMAIIGPRPLLPIDQPAEPALRLSVAPGLTGWAQINGGKLVSAEEKNSLDEWYVRNASLRVDAEIVWRTFVTVVLGDRRKEDQLAAALARARKDQKRPSFARIAETRQGVPPFAEHNT